MVPVCVFCPDNAQTTAFIAWRAKFFLDRIA